MNQSEEVQLGIISRYWVCSNCGRSDIREHKPMWCGSCQGKYMSKGKPMRNGYVLILDDGRGENDLWDAEFTFMPEGFLLVHDADDPSQLVFHGCGAP